MQPVLSRGFWLLGGDFSIPGPISRIADVEILLLARLVLILGTLLALSKPRKLIMGQGCTSIRFPTLISSRLLLRFIGYERPVNPGQKSEREMVVAT